MSCLLEPSMATWSTKLDGITGCNSTSSSEFTCTFCTDSFMPLDYLCSNIPLLGCVESMPVAFYNLLNSWHSKVTGMQPKEFQVAMFCADELSKQLKGMN